MYLAEGKRTRLGQTCAADQLIRERGDFSWREAAKRAVGLQQVCAVQPRHDARAVSQHRAGPLRVHVGRARRIDHALFDRDIRQGALRPHQRGKHADDKGRTGMAF